MNLKINYTELDNIAYDLYRKYMIQNYENNHKHVDDGSQLGILSIENFILIENDSIYYDVAKIELRKQKLKKLHEIY